ncbi:MAG TPA: hypothetical protein IAC28_04215 [Candidatus Aphodovivens excrementavium]|nr:hypothetical protein [Candidatus Aphodovivens excrementavium]
MKQFSHALAIVLVFELILVFGQILPPHVAAPMIVVTECTAFFLGSSIIFRAIKEVKSRAKSGERVYTAIEHSLGEALPPKALFMVKHEVGIFVSLGRLIARKKDVPPDAVEIKYGHQMRLLLVVLIATGIVEIVAVELLVPIDALRWIILFISIYSLLWIIGLMAATIVYPHYATSDELVIRFFHHHTIRIPITPECCFSIGERSATKNKTIIHKDESLALNVLGSTNASVLLPEKTEITVDGVPVSASSVSFSVDAPETLRRRIHRIVGQ